MKNFEITKEQILELVDYYSKNTLKQWFPEAFKEPFTGWAKDPRPSNNQLWICYFENDEFKYGIDYKGIWFKNENHTFKYSDMANIRPATQQEVETALINEAKKRFDFTKELNWNFNNVHYRISNPAGISISYKDGALHFGGGILFYNGTWATIIEQPLTLEERIEKIEQQLKIK